MPVNGPNAPNQIAVENSNEAAAAQRARDHTANNRPAEANAPADNEESKQASP